MAGYRTAILFNICYTNVRITNRERGLQHPEEPAIQDTAPEQPGHQCHEEPLSPDTDCGHPDGTLSEMESDDQKDWPRDKTYIFKATGKFPTTYSNG